MVAIRAAGGAAILKGSVRIVAHFRCPDKRRRDLDNLLASIKPYIDALVHCEIIEDDDLIEEILLRKTIDRLDPGLTLEVSSCELSAGFLSGGGAVTGGTSSPTVRYPTGSGTPRIS